jgi:hypothetical protein
VRNYGPKPVLYVKHGKRFMPVDWRNGTTVNRRFYATMFTTEEKAQVEADLAHPKNAHLEWEWRK